jgi:hypothetical protein
MTDIRELRARVEAARTRYIGRMRAKKQCDWIFDPIDRRQALAQVELQLKGAREELDAAKTALAAHQALIRAEHMARKKAPVVSSSYVKNPSWLAKALGR